MFELRATYTREQIHASVGGNMQSYLPHFDGRVVCACLRPDKNPGAPDILLVGIGDGIEGAAEMLVSQSGSIPIFLKRDTNRWEYFGHFRVERHSRDAAEISAQAQRSGRNDITSIIYMANVGHP